VHRHDASLRHALAGHAPGKPSFAGRIDEVRVYSRCITNAEVFSNYLGEKPPAADGLVDGGNSMAT